MPFFVHLSYFWGALWGVIEEFLRFFKKLKIAKKIKNF